MTPDQRKALVGLFTHELNNEAIEIIKICESAGFTKEEAVEEALNDSEVKKLDDIIHWLAAPLGKQPAPHES